MAEHHTIWTRDRTPPRFPPLTEDRAVDVAIIGAGITGLTSAYLLANSGLSVVVLEKQQIGAGMTSHTTAFLNYFIDTYLHDLNETYGSDQAETVWESEMAAIDRIEQIVQRESLDCEFTRCPLYVYPVDEPGYKKLYREYETARDLGFTVRWRKEPLGFLRYDQHLLLPRNAKFHPLKYLYQLADRLAQRGVPTFEQSGVETLDDNGIIKLDTPRATVRARHIIMATHTPLFIEFGSQARLKPYQTYVISGTLPAGTLPEAMYIDTADPYHYLRIDPHPDSGRDRFLLGGSDHPTGHPSAPNPHRQLEQYLRSLLPDSLPQFDGRWSGEVFASLDGLPFIGPSLENEKVLLATGFAGDGMTFGTLSAMINADYILGNENRWAALYQPDRLKKTGSVLKRQGHVMRQYAKRFFGNRPGPDAIQKLKPETGTVIRDQGKLIAVSKNKEGSVTKRSAICTHLGCTVGWNNNDKTWDCPCHGSRYKSNGEVPNGPTTKPLKKNS